MRLIVDMTDKELEAFKIRATREGLSYRALINKYIIRLKPDDANFKTDVEINYREGWGIKRLAKEIGVSHYSVNKEVRLLLKEHPEYEAEHNRKMKPEYLRLKKKGFKKINDK